MPKYKVTYMSTEDDDCCSVWTEASCKEAAIDYVNHEYWDVGNIIEVSEQK